MLPREGERLEIGWRPGTDYYEVRLSSYPGPDGAYRTITMQVNVRMSRLSGVSLVDRAFQEMAEAFRTVAPSAGKGAEEGKEAGR